MKSIILLLLVNAAAGRTLRELREDYVKGCGRPYRTEPNVSVVHGQQPWQVAIFAKDMFGCEGVLVADKLVLTSAKCIIEYRNSQLRVELGRDDREGYPREHHRVRRKIIHENFTDTDSRPGSLYDIALIELAEPVRYKKYILPVCLPEKNWNLIGTSVTLSRWGWMTEWNPYSRHPDKEDISVIANDICKSNTDLGLCVSPYRSSHGFLHEGSPLYLERDGRVHVVGLSTFACIGLAYQYHINVAHFTDWINTNIEKYSISEAEDDEEDHASMTLIELEDHLSEIVSVMIAEFVALLVSLAILCAILVMLFRYRKLTEELKYHLDVARSEEPGSYLQAEQP